MAVTRIRVCFPVYWVLAEVVRYGPIGLGVMRIRFSIGIVLAATCAAAGCASDINTEKDALEAAQTALPNISLAGTRKQLCPTGSRNTH